MVVTANDVGDVHVEIVYHHAEIVSGGAIGAGDDQVVKFFVVEFDAAFHGVVPSGDAVLRHFETHHRRHAFWNGRQGFACFRTPFAIVHKVLLVGFGFSALCIQLFFGGVAVIGRAIGQHFGDDFFVAVKAFGLVERAFVIAHVYPMHAIQNCLYRSRG